MMFIRLAKLFFDLPGSHSLKDKRQVRQRIVDRTVHKFRISVAEVEAADAHSCLVLGLAVVSGTEAQAIRQMDQVIRFIEDISEAELADSDFWTVTD